MRRLVLVIAVLLVVDGGVARAQAPDPAPQDHADSRESARALVQEGAQLFRDGRRLAGVRKFEEAYALYPAPEILYNLGKGYRDVGKSALAHRALSRFVREAPDSPRHAEAELLIRDLELVVSQLVIEVRGDPGLRVTIDGDDVGVTPLAQPVAVEPGVHQVAAYRGDERFGQEQVAATRGKRITVVVKPTPEMPPPAVLADRIRSGEPTATDPITSPPVSSSKPVYTRWWFWTGVGAVVAGSVAIAVLATQGNDENSGLPSLGRFPFEEF